MAGTKFNKGVLMRSGLQQPVQTVPKRTKRAAPFKVQLHGSIYKSKSLTPGPGHYKLELPPADPPSSNLKSSGHKARNTLCNWSSVPVPGPGAYTLALPEIGEGKPATFQRSWRFSVDEEGIEAELEIPESFSSMKYVKPPTYSFQRTARPFRD